MQGDASIGPLRALICLTGRRSGHCAVSVDDAGAGHRSSGVRSLVFSQLNPALGQTMNTSSESESYERTGRAHRPRGREAHHRSRGRASGSGDGGQDGDISDKICTLASTLKVLHVGKKTGCLIRRTTRQFLCPSLAGHQQELVQSGPDAGRVPGSYRRSSPGNDTG